MATMNPYIPERRQIMDRRHLAASASSMGANRAGADSNMTAERASAQRTGTHAMNAVDWISMVLLIVGGLNWGAVGLFG
ncbi:MAG: DUF378 domain-containing protein, partial [Burkholderiaceae bacterium]